MLRDQFFGELAKIHPSEDSACSPELAVPCRSLHRRNKKRRQVSKTSFIKALCHGFHDIRSPAVALNGLQTVFHDNYFSKDGFGCRASLLDLGERSPTLALVVDTLVLLVVGTTWQDQSLLQAASQKYSQSLHSLRRELNSLKSTPEPFNFITTIHTLQVCELFDCIAEGPESWRQHMKGLKTIAKNVSKQQQRRSAEQIGWVLSEVVKVPFGLWNGLLNHDDWAYEQNLEGTALEQVRVNCSLDSLYYYGIVPMVLQRAASFCRTGRQATTDQVAIMLEEIFATEDTLHRALTDAYADIEGQAYRTLPTKVFEDSTVAANILDSTFPHSYIFVDILTALQHMYYWMSILALRCMHIRIRQLVTWSAYPVEFDYCGLSMQTLVRSAYECADNLCMSMAYMTMARHEYLGLFCAMAPIQIASIFYKTHSDEMKLEWCQEASMALKGRGLLQLQIG